jgi:hypothetical protein
MMIESLGRGLAGGVTSALSFAPAEDEVIFQALRRIDRYIALS